MATGTDGVDEQPKLKLYSYWRSSCSFRVRFALNLKGLKYEYIPVHLLKGEQFTPEFTKLNPLGTVPVLVDGDVVVSDSLAILMYLDGKYPQHPLLPRDLHKNAINFQAANIVSSSIQPIQYLVIKLPVMLLSGLRKYIAENASQDEKLSWVKSHIEKGFAALENVLKDYAGRYATGDEIYLADLFIAPQIDAAIKRFQIDMNQFPLLSRLNEEYSQLPAFCNAIPEEQPDFLASNAN